MRSLSAFSLGRPRVALLLFLVATIALAAFGGSRQHVQPASLKVDGTESAQAQALIAGRFDESSTVPILLSGPSAAIRSQGHDLADRLAERPGVTLASPWNAPTLRATLRPAPDQLLLLASITGTTKEVQSRAEQIRTVTTQSVKDGVTAHVTGVPLVTKAITSSSSEAVHRVDLIAIPVLLLVLLLVFRSPLAAAIPVLFGGATILSATGAVQLLSLKMPVDGLGTALASMMGLALAVDYSLLMVSRFREERRRGLDVEAAAAGAVVGTRHTVMTAGASIVLAMVLVAALGPGSPVVSAAVGVGAAAILAVLGASLAMPAALVLTGPWLERAGSPAGADAAAVDGPSSRARRDDPAVGSLWARIGTVAMRRPYPTVTAGCAALALLAIPALSLKTSAPDASQLPPSSSARADVDAVTKAAGAGWGSSFELVAVAREGTMTTPARLRALSALQAELAKDPDVRAVLGPGTISARAEKLRRDGRRLLKQQKALAAEIPKQSERLSKIKGSVGKLEGGVGGLNGAFDEADTATKSLDNGSAKLADGVTQLREGVKGAADGVKTLVGRLGGAVGGTDKLATGAGRAQTGSAQIADAVHTLGVKVAQLKPQIQAATGAFVQQRETIKNAASESSNRNENALTQLAAAQQALTGVRQNAASARVAKALEAAKTQLKGSNVAANLNAVAGQLDAQIATADGLAKQLATVDVHPLAERARALSKGLATLKAGLKDLGANVNDLTGGAGGFQAALSRLDGGAGRLGTGIDKLKAGVAGVAGSVDASRKRSDGLVKGLTGAKNELEGVSADPSGSTKPGEQSQTSKAIDSGYFVLAALDGRDGAGATGLNVNRGGQAARVVVVPRTSPSDPRTAALYRRLTAKADQFERATASDAAIGGPAAQLIDYEHAADSRFPTIVLVLAIATILLLAALLRSLVVPVIGVALTLLTVAATIGMMGLIFGGGLDATTVIAVFAVMFALSIDYQVFILGRIREEFDRRRDHEQAIAAGLSSTAHVVTGAAVSMLAVFLAFATADVPGLRQFGLGLAIAIALDATVVRLVVLPAALKIAGRLAWGDPPAERRSESGDGRRGDGRREDDLGGSGDGRGDRRGSADRRRREAPGGARPVLDTLTGRVPDPVPEGPVAEDDAARRSTRLPARRGPLGDVGVTPPRRPASGSAD
ncbi:MMPL family transporter [Patulibacter minatonensis]|uniref:MMPL family transporter n=1 Tax=Patulibacter minatonensis TaxID=298163 RepID=UPI000479FFA1|nr:MMPL family transporter [Patulibacter minatonensis]